jgi:hypothetical protein
MREYNAKEGVTLQKREYQWRAKYNLTAEQYFDLFEKQEGLCAICVNPASPGRLLDVDHDHQCCEGNMSCGDCIRGLLCSSCNGALGFVKDNPDTIMKMMAYLKAYSGKK